MLKFKFLLWMLTKLLQRAVKTKPACATYVDGKNLVFQIQTINGMGRHFTIQNGKVTSTAGLTPAPQFSMIFKDAASGYAVLSSKEGKDAFLTALREEVLVIKGDFIKVTWFQGLIEYL